MASRVEKESRPQQKLNLKTLGDIFFDAALQDQDPQTRRLWVDKESQKLSVKERLKRKVQEKNLSFLDHVVKPVISKGADIFIARGEKTIVPTINPEHPAGFEERFTELAKDPSSLFILLSSHQGHADIATTAVESGYLTGLTNKIRPENPSRGYMLTIASSLESGHQKILLQNLIKGLQKEFLPKNFLSTGAYTRKKDTSQYGIEADDSEYNKSIKEIIRGNETRKADGLAFYLEGTVEGGRRKKKWGTEKSIKGLQPLDCENFYKLLKVMKICHRNPVLIFIGSDGANSILNPNFKNWPTVKAIKALAGNKPSKDKFFDVKVSMPITFDEMLAELQKDKQGKIEHQDVANYVGHNLAKLVRPEARGVYA